jgi:uncharacterized protein with NAD-binding domain and iron-sulfur cluster
LLGYEPLSGRERIAASRAGFALWASRSSREETFEQWLVRHGQTERVIRRLWDPIVVATLNAPSSAVSFRAARHVFREAFFVPHGADMGLFTIPLGDVFQAARRYVEARDGTVEPNARVDGILVGDRRARGVRLSTGREIAADAVISAVPPDELAGLASGIPELGPVVDAARRLEWSPIVNVHLTFNQKVLDDAFAIAIDSLIQAIFRRGAPRGASTQAAPSAPHREGAALRPRDPQTLVVSPSAAVEWIGQTDEQIVSKLLDALHELLPAVREAKLVDSLVLRYRHATFVPAPGSHELRPKSRTPIPGLYLAGDWTSTGWPSTIESAVLSGVYAAAAVESDAAASGTAETDAAAEAQTHLTAEDAERRGE